MPKFDNSKLQKRVLSALVMAPASFALIWYGGWPFSALIAALSAVALYEWVRIAVKTQHKTLLSLAGVVYVGICFASFVMIREHYSAYMALLFVLMVWSSDIGAYFAGKIIGGPKMSREISPNKTWAGYVGAVISPAVIGLAFTLFYTTHKLPEDMDFNRYGVFFGAALAGVAIGIVGQSGDLLISWLKRVAGVKDSSHLIPGHGGLLDRIDSLMLAGPVFFAVVKKFEYVFYA